MKERPQKWRVAANILNKQSRTADKGWSFRLGLDEVLTASHCKMYHVRNQLYSKHRSWKFSLVRPKQRKRDMRCGTWNVTSLYRVGSLTAAARELGRYKLDLVGVQEIMWDKGGTVRAGDYNFSTENEKNIINWEQDFLYTTE